MKPMARRVDCHDGDGDDDEGGKDDDDDEELPPSLGVGGAAVYPMGGVGPPASGVWLPARCSKKHPVARALHCPTLVAGPSVGWVGGLSLSVHCLGNIHRKGKVLCIMIC